MAGERDLLRNYPDYEPGSIPPLGLFFQAPMYVDLDVARHDAVVFAVGRPSLAIRMLTKDLFRDDPVVIAPITSESRDEERLRAGSVTVEELVAAAMGDEEVRMAGERDLLRNYPDYEPGSIPPLGLYFQAPMYVDVDVARRDAVVFAAGRPTLAIRMLTKDLFRDDPVIIAPLTRESEREERERAEAVTVEEPGLSVTESVAEDERAE
jgi:prolyl-tRNA editing enzyme YbaK/EbsC (Cys-tRNA(Pro) deacylase)